MALRKILTEGDEQLLKHSRKVEKFDDRLHTLIDDMRETLENSGGVGLAAPQVGILRRVVVLLDVNKEPESSRRRARRVSLRAACPFRAFTAMLPVRRGQRSAHRTAMATGSSVRARASLHSASATKPSIWMAICSPKRSRSTSTRRICRVVTRNNAYRIHGHAGLRRAEFAGAHRCRP